MQQPRDIAVIIVFIFVFISAVIKEAWKNGNFALFPSVKLNPCHIRHDLLPLRKVMSYNTRYRPRSLCLPRFVAFPKRGVLLLCKYYTTLFKFLPFPCLW